MSYGNKKHIKKNAITIAIFSAFISGHVLAFEADEDKPDEQMETIIVTGSVRGHTALETSYGVSVVGAKDIDKLASIGTADLLDSIPSLYGEGYGGETNTGLNARGIRENFNTYISLQEDGLPILYTPFFSEYEIRFDPTYSRVETVLGGPSGVFTAQGASATVNFISRIPDKAEADIAYSLTDYGTSRADFFVGGPITDKWTATIGGYYRIGEGVRDVGYNGDDGGQIRANLRRFLGAEDEGVATLSVKIIDDNTIFYTPQIVDFSSGKPKPVPGFDPRTDALNGPDTMAINNKTVDGIVPMDLRNGQGSNTTQISFKLEWDFDNGFSFLNHSRISDITTRSFDLRGGNSSSIFTASDFIANNSATLFDAFPTATSTRLRTVNDGEIITNPDTWNGNGLLTRQNLVSYRKDHSNFINNMKVTYSNYEDLDIAVGFQYWNMESTSRYIQTDLLLDVTNQANLIDLEAVDSNGEVVGYLTDNGVLTYSSLDNSGSWDLESKNYYANIEYQLTDDLRVDAGYRYEDVIFNVSGQDVNFGAPLPNSDPMVLADDVAAINPNGKLYHGQSNPSDSTWTAGANYTITEEIAVYARYTDAHDFGFNGLDFAYFNIPAFGVPAGSNLLVSDGATNLKFGEMGFRIQQDDFSFFGTAFLTQNIDVSQRIRLPDGQLSEEIIDTEAKGFEFQGNWQISDYFSFDFSGVVQRAEVKAEGPQDGLKVNRLPEVQLRTTLNYTFDNGAAYLTAVHYGDRFANNENTLELPAVTTFDAGVFYNLTDATVLSLIGKNLSDEFVPQTGALDNNAGDNPYPEYLYAGHMPGRRFTLGVKFSF